MTSIASMRRSPKLAGASLLRGWAPVALAILVAVAAGWSIMWLNASLSRVTQAKNAVPGLTIDVSRPEALLLSTSSQRLRATGSGALAATPGVPTHESSFYTETFNRIESAGASGGERGLAAAVERGVRDMAVTQDGVYDGGAPSLVAARHAPVAVRELRASLTALDAALVGRARLWSRLTEGGTMLIMLIAALGLIVLLRRFDRMRGRMNRELHALATHDPLTGLANRRQLASDLATAMSGATTVRPARLVTFDLDGFKAYNDMFGHHGGDLLLTRLARSLAAAAGPRGTSYRLGGDEFCSLFPEGADQAEVRRCVEALGEAGEAFSIACSHGSVLLPNEAIDPDLAMQIADERMYAEKNSSRASAGQQTCDLALKMLSMQEPEVEDHSVHVAALVDRIGRRLQLSEVALEDLERAAELHDVGKIAIPYAVLHKPGPLDADEWEMMRRHPTVGANILSTAPALAHVAEIVRNTHERYDGHGYPAGVAGTAIPLASRIISVCDSFDAMVSNRPYSPPMSDEGALDELRRNAGLQFDPDVVDAFCDEYREHGIERNAETTLTTREH